MIIAAFEGINGIGKTTLVERVRRALESEYEVSALCDPGVHHEHPANRLIRPLATMHEWRHAKTRAMLFMAARCELAAEIDRLRKLRHVILLDRYLLSFYAYQSAAFDNNVTCLEKFVSLLALPAPDVTVLLTGNPEMACYRATAASVKPDAFEAGRSPMLNALQERYKRYAELDMPGVGSVVKIAVEDYDTQEAVFEKVMPTIQTVLRKEPADEPRRYRDGIGATGRA